MPPFEDDPTPPPIDLSRPRIIVEPTLEGLANGIINTYSEMVDTRKHVEAISAKMVTRDECAQMRAACPAAVRARRPTEEVRRAWWSLQNIRIATIVKLVGLLGALATGWWAITSEVAEIRAQQRDMRTQIVKELRGNESARRVDHKSAQRGR